MAAEFWLSRNTCAQYIFYVKQKCFPVDLLFIVCDMSLFCEENAKQKVSPIRSVQFHQVEPGIWESSGF